MLNVAGPAGVNPPAVKVLNSTALEINWLPPLQLNGVIELYIIRLPEPQLEIRNNTYLRAVVMELIPYTEYSISLTACTCK